MSWIGFVLDLVLVGMLAVLIYYAVGLQRRLKTLRQSKEEFEALIRTLVSNTERAERGIVNLKDTTLNLGERLQQHIARGSALKDELQFMLDAANQSVDRLVRQISEARVAPPEGHVAKEASVVRDNEARHAMEPENENVAPVSSAEQDLLKAIERLR